MIIIYRIDDENKTQKIRKPLTETTIITEWMDNNRRNIHRLEKSEKNHSQNRQ